MGGASRGRVSLVATLALAAISCSTSRFDHQSCRTDDQCRSTFGFGAVCGGSGLCENAQPTARCSRSFPDDLLTAPENYLDTIVFGSLMDLSSPAHVIRERAIRLAVKEANTQGGLADRKDPRVPDAPSFGLVMCDIRQDPSIDGLGRTDAAVASAQFLSRTLGVSAIVGPSASTDAEQVWQAVHDNGTLVISPAATSPALSTLETNTSEDNPGLFWRTAPTDALQGRVIAQDMLARKVAHAYVIRETGAYGEGLANVFSDNFQMGGGTIDLVSITSQQQASDAAAMVPTDNQAEVLFVSSQQAWIVSFLNAAGASAGYAQRNIFLTDAAANQSVFMGASGAASVFPRVRGTRPAPRDPSQYVFASFSADYRNEYAGEDPNTATFSAHAYDAGWLALYGAAWSWLQEGNVTGAGIGRGLRHVSSGAATNILPASWLGVISAFRSGQGINVSGASGELDFDPVTRDLSAPVEIWTISQMGGQFTMVPLATQTP